VKKRSSLSYVLILGIFLSSQIFAQNNIVSKTTTNPTNKETSAVKPNNPVTIEKIEQDTSEALTLIQDNYVDGKKIDYNELFKSAIDSMLHSLDPHSNYFDAKEFEQFRTDQSSQYFGIGASIGDLHDANGENTTTYIKATFDGAPAYRAGLRYGDKIVEVNGTKMAGKPFSEVRTFLRGPRGTTAKIVVERYGTGKRETIEIIRDAVPQPSISEAYMIRPGIGYMSMRGGFNQTTYNEFRAAMQSLKAQGMQQLVIDLRDNGGGLVNQAYRVANTFLSRGQVVFTQKGRLDGTADVYRADNLNPETMPLVLMVNRNTASASEILAGALQDHDRAIVIGENTFGKGLVQNPFMIEYGSMLLLTIAKYETPSGRLIQRDYSNGNLYDYYTKGGLSNTGAPQPNAPKGQEKKTDTGRIVYGGDGITPDEFTKPDTITSERDRQQKKLNDPIFSYALDLSFGKIAGMETYKVDRAIKFNYDLTAADFPISENLFQSFKKYAVDKYKTSPVLIDKEREFVERNLRSELVTAAYGTTTTLQIINDIDNQIKSAITALPKAKQLALASAKLNSQRAGTDTNR
jgi:carboxyl-terminal processing protease